MRTYGKPLRLPAARDFLWQYMHSTPLTGKLSNLDAARLAALERDVVRGWEPWSDGGGMRHEQEMNVAKGIKCEHQSGPREQTSSAFLHRGSKIICTAQLGEASPPSGPGGDQPPTLFAPGPGGLVASAGGPSVNSALFSDIHRRLMRGWLAAAVVLAAAGCGGTSPAGPSDTGASGTGQSFGPSASVPIYIGTVGLSDGRNGTIMLRPASSFAVRSLAASRLLDVVVRLFEAPLHAQGSPATGELLLPDEVVDLMGTYDGDTFDVSGGGYSLRATVSAGSLSGSGTGPGGASVAVGPPDPPNVTPEPAPSDATGVYTGTYSITAPSYSQRTLASNGNVVESCAYHTLITGTLTLELRPAGSGTYAALLLDAWRESDGPPGSCNPRLANTPDPYLPFNGGSTSPSGPKRAEAAVSAAALHFGWIDQGSGPAGGILSRTGTFVGTLSGSAVVARYSRGQSWPPHPQGAAPHLIASQGYQGSVDVTLAKK